MNISLQQTNSVKRQENGEAFDRYEKMLRTWFVAYGIGGPILFMIQASLRAKLVAAPNGWLIGILFLAGLAVQVFESFLYKMTTWYLYRGEVENDTKSCRTYAFSEWVERNYWIDIILDLATFALFAYATILAFPTVMGNP
jgi:hypothetical protein